jgi:hypothetical protein
MCDVLNDGYHHEEFNGYVILYKLTIARRLRSIPSGKENERSITTFTTIHNIRPYHKQNEYSLHLYSL